MDNPDNQKYDFSVREIRFILENYHILDDGKTPDDGLANPDYGVRIQISRSLRAAFQRPKELIIDIDRALQSLKPTQRGIVVNMDMFNVDIYKLAYWYRFNYLEILAIELYSLRMMRQFLNQGISHNDKKTTKKRKYETQG